jgi:hypothetical protein
MPLLYSHPEQWETLHGYLLNRLSRQRSSDSDRRQVRTSGRGSPDKDQQVVVRVHQGVFGTVEPVLQSAGRRPRPSRSARDR